MKPAGLVAIEEGRESPRQSSRGGVDQDHPDAVLLLGITGREGAQDLRVRENVHPRCSWDGESEKEEEPKAPRLPATVVVKKVGEHTKCGETVVFSRRGNGDRKRIDLCHAAPRDREL